MNEYIAMWKNYANFKDRTSRKGYWMAILFNILVIMALYVLLEFFPFISIFTLIYELAVIVPMIAILVRRLRDAGKVWYLVFMIFVPIIGQIVLLYFLVQGTKSDEGVQV